jgi:hypothetical protein
MQINYVRHRTFVLFKRPSELGLASGVWLLGKLEYRHRARMRASFGEVLASDVFDHGLVVTQLLPLLSHRSRQLAALAFEREHPPDMSNLAQSSA